MKVAYLILIAIHGLIHLLGFVKAFNMADVSQLTTPISRPMGTLWLLAALATLVYAAMFLFGARYGWIVGAVSIVLSQALVMMYWNDAKFGTIPNLIILVVVLVAYGHASFNGMVDWEIAALTEQTNERNLIITEDDITDLPPPVKTWLQKSGAVGLRLATVGSVRQIAEMKLTPEQAGWYKADAVQYTRTDRPGFVWSVDVKMNRLIHFVGRDKFVDGKGSMLIKANALIPVVNATGPKLDEGTLQRYLGEMVWFPAVAVSEHVTWTPIDSLTAKATMEYLGTTGSGVFYFDTSGDFIRFSAMRYQGNEPDSERREWVLTVDDYAILDGIRIPSKMKATWRLTEGDWTWLQLEIIDISHH